MHEMLDRRGCFRWSGGGADSKVVLGCEAKFSRIMELLDENPELLEFEVRVLEKLGRGGKTGRPAT